MDNDGATKLPVVVREEDKCRPEGSVRTYIHSWSWVWKTNPNDIEGGLIWTDRLRCTICLQEKRSSREEGEVLIKRLQQITDRDGHAS